MLYIQLKTNYRDFVEGELLTTKEYYDYVLDTGHNIPNELLRTVCVRRNEIDTRGELRLPCDNAKVDIIQERGAF